MSPARVIDYLHGQIRTRPIGWNCQAIRFPANRSLIGPDRAAIRDATRDPDNIHCTSVQKPWMFTAFIPKWSLSQRCLALTAWRDAPPTRRSIGCFPEALFNGPAYALGSSFTVDRSLHSTNVGHVLVRGRRPVRCLGSFPRPGALPAARGRGL
jgi:hypothetical protein